MDAHYIQCQDCKSYIRDDWTDIRLKSDFGLHTYCPCCESDDILEVHPDDLPFIDTQICVYSPAKSLIHTNYNKFVEEQG